MNNYLEMQTELTARLQVASNSTLFPSSRIQTLIKNSHLWATSLFIWQELVKGRRTTTALNDEGTPSYYYDYPNDFRTGTIIRMKVAGEKYERKNYEDWLDYKDDYEDSTTKIFSNYGRQFFIFPTPSAAGLEICVWGAIQATQLSADADLTIFSQHNTEGNEAIIKKALAVALAASDGNRATKEEREAIAILTVLHDKQKKATQRDHRLNHPSFIVPDFFAGSGAISQPGGFSINPDVWGE